MTKRINKETFTHALLVTVGKEIRSGQRFDRSKLVDAVYQCCFQNENDMEHAERWKKIIDRRLDILLTPDSSETNDRLPLIQYIEEACDKCEGHECGSAHACPMGAFEHDDEGRVFIDSEACIACGLCVSSCIAGAIVNRSDFAKVASALIQEPRVPAYAILAPSFTGQFGRDLKAENVKAMFESLGFTGVYEVALAADITTMLEAQEFCERMRSGADFMITSCCCPAFIKLVEKRRPRLAGVVSPSVSPMVALGRLLKAREPHCKVVFIGPCIAKKAEARLPDMGDAIDCVLTFKEARALLEAGGIDLNEISAGITGSSPLADASHDGRIYAHTGGVSQAITCAIKQLCPDLEVRAVKGNGLKQCAQLLEQAEQGSLNANFMEGMACPGGCVGGPGTVIDSEEGAHHVASFADTAPVHSVFDNDLAIWWLEHYAKDRSMFSRKYNPEGFEDPDSQARLEEHQERAAHVADVARAVRSRRE